MPSKKYTDEDVARWVAVDAVDLPDAAVRILKGAHLRGRLINRFSRMHQLAGLAQIAAGDFGRALAHYSAAGTAWAYLLEIGLHDFTIDIELFPRAHYGLMLAMASSDSTAVERMMHAYTCFVASNRGSLASTPFGEAICALLRGQPAGATKRVRDLASESSATANLLEAIITGDEPKLATGLQAIHPVWKNRVRYERLQRFPDAVCDDRVLCWVRFAERVWGHLPQIDISLSQIPSAVLTATPSHIESTLPIGIAAPPN